VSIPNYRRNSEEHHDRLFLAFIFLLLCIVTGFVLVLIFVEHHIQDRRVKAGVHICLYGVLLGLHLYSYQIHIETVEDGVQVKKLPIRFCERVGSIIVNES
jgi:hypothetical protein